MLFGALPRDDSLITPGVVHLPNWLPLEQQASIVSQLREIARGLVGTPLAMARPQLKSGDMQVFMLHLGRMWVTRPYRYVTHVSGRRVPPIPDNLVELSRSALAAASLYDDSLAQATSSFRPDMALVNYYPPGATMGLHQDRNEASPAPIVSLSIGDEALFRIGGTENRNRPWDDVTLAVTPLRRKYLCPLHPQSIAEMNTGSVVKRKILDVRSNNRLRLNIRLELGNPQRSRCDRHCEVIDLDAIKLVQRHLQWSCANVVKTEDILLTDQHGQDLVLHASQADVGLGEEITGTTGRVADRIEVDTGACAARMTQKGGETRSPLGKTRCGVDRRAAYSDGSAPVAGLSERRSGGGVNHNGRG